MLRKAIPAMIWPTCMPVKKADRDWKRRLLLCCDGLGEGFSFENMTQISLQLETLVRRGSSSRISAV
jgi:uncharacterized protein (DUF2235 family)